MLDVNGYPYHFPPYGLYTLPNTLNNAALKPEMTKSWEVGDRIEILRSNRLGLDATYYSKSSGEPDHPRCCFRSIQDTHSRY